MTALAHAILIEGSSREVRLEKAKELLKGHFADDPMAAAKIENDTFEDLIYLEPEEGKDIMVDQIGELISLFKQKPFVSTGKACVIQRGERLSEHAQNKMLKLLEEPAPGDVIIIMTENAQILLPTVRSRLMRIWLGHAEPDLIADVKDLKDLIALLIYGGGTLAEANSILARYESTREEAMAFLGAFQLALRNFSVGRFTGTLIGQGGENEWIAESAAKVKQKHGDRMRGGLKLAERALRDIERGDRVRYALRRMALSMWSECI